MTKVGPLIVLIIFLVLGFLSYSFYRGQQQARAIKHVRNVVRQLDVKTLAKVMDLYRQKNSGQIPPKITNEPKIIKSGARGADLCPELQIKYIGALPVDPSIENISYKERGAIGGSVLNCDLYDTGFSIIRNEADQVIISAPKTELDKDNPTIIQAISKP